MHVLPPMFALFSDSKRKWSTGEMGPHSIHKQNKGRNWWTQDGVLREFTRFREVMAVVGFQSYPPYLQRQLRQMTFSKDFLNRTDSLLQQMAGPFSLLLKSVSIPLMSSGMGDLSIIWYEYLCRILDGMVIIVGVLFSFTFPKRIGGYISRPLERLILQTRRTDCRVAFAMQKGPSSAAHKQSAWVSKHDYS